MRETIIRLDVVMTAEDGVPWQFLESTLSVRPSGWLQSRSRRTVREQKTEPDGSRTRNAISDLPSWYIFLLANYGRVFTV